MDVSGTFHSISVQGLTPVKTPSNKTDDVGTPVVVTVQFPSPVGTQDPVLGVTTLASRVDSHLKSLSILVSLSDDTPDRNPYSLNEGHTSI